MIFEELCKCGSIIPLGYGYYNYGKPVKCINCGRINRKSTDFVPKNKKNKLKSHRRTNGS